MIIDKEVFVKWNNANKKHYLSKGYGPYENKKEFKVKVEDLNKGSRTLVNVKCEYCEIPKIKKIMFGEYYTAVMKHITKKYACKKCIVKKTMEGTKIKAEKGQLLPGEKFFYSIKENRMTALKDYIEKNQSISGLADSLVYGYFYTYNDDIFKAIEELGYDHMKLRSMMPRGYWADFDVVKEAIEEFILMYKKFPTGKEMQYELKINPDAIKKHGGITEIKKKMNYKNNESLIDNRGDYNRSSYELITANFLIAQGISYKREQKPFHQKNSRHRSDFTFYPKNKKPIHVEVWGFLKRDNTEVGIKYKKHREEKEKLYQGNDIILISIEPEIFKQSYEKIEKNLNNIFSKYLSLDFEKLEQRLLIPANKISDKEILELVMSYSNDDEFFPPISTIENKHNGIYAEVIKRYGNFSEFAEKYNKKMHSNSPNYWNHERIRERLVYMIKTYHQIYSEKIVRKMDDYFLKGLTDAIYTRGGWMYHRMKAYKYCLENNIDLPESELKYIRSKCRSLNIPKTTPVHEIIELSLQKTSC